MIAPMDSTKKTFFDGHTFRSTTPKKCTNCGIDYFPKYSLKDNSRFCSNKCSHQSLSKQTTSICKRCKKEFSHKSCITRVFCSRKCKSDYSTVERTKSWIDNRKKIHEASRKRAVAKGIRWGDKWAKSNPDRVRELKRMASKRIPKWYVAKAINIPVSLIPDSFYEAYKSALNTRRLLKEMCK